MKIKKFIVITMLSVFTLCLTNVNVSFTGNTPTVQIGTIEAKADVNPGPTPLSITYDTGIVVLNDANPGPTPVK